MKQRPRIYYSDTQKALMWDRWQKGDSLHTIARLFDRGHSSVQRILSETNGTSLGDLGGLAGADATCTAAALAATPALTGTWTAWLSDSGTNAVDRILDGEYQLLDGTVVANDKIDLTDGSLDAAINRNENNTLFAEENTWTGTQPDGTVTATTCNDWTDATGGGSGTRGDTDVTGAGWTDLGGSNPCNFVRSLYCFADIDVSPPPPPPPTIPTLGFFGLGILLVLLAGTGILVARRRHS